MPAGGAAATGVHGDDIIDLGVCIKLLKKSIVLIPLLIMVTIFVIRVTLTHHPDKEGKGKANWTVINASIAILTDERQDYNIVNSNNSSSSSSNSITKQGSINITQTLYQVRDDIVTTSHQEQEVQKDHQSLNNSGAGLNQTWILNFASVFWCLFQIANSHDIWTRLKTRKS